jgi:hypothetical protein
MTKEEEEEEEEEKEATSPHLLRVPLSPFAHRCYSTSV